jgi:hypothetical protein
MVTFLALLVSASILVLTLELLRRRQLREKYAAIWILVSVVAVVLAVFPGSLNRLAEFLGFGVPVNLLFFAAFLLLLFVSMQLSLEIGRREDENERLAEEVALLRREIDDLRGGRPGDEKAEGASGSDDP